ncbi:hypothetical protein SARC_12103 [Sphaeroforma arctica JP610]|uniref:BTB domain-containing protein n=1 Tax=Sphaeroforma arctica JP610 TaxID=667725 RepID=A0A0L0FFX2_9EUKA|nr:hypothetical protein SARC_12103 [Sphaeroforma arctica JP610]KNC75371.1 hypothetical protein SARC_12103 [Sphaeroforma arctica JP610]|eukprot:XP_014149273.1 hypothetical protein SARC_12103 [Sphaeroforma arctica JP610]
MHSSVITFVVNHRAPTAELSGANMGTTFAWDNHGADIPIPVPTSTLDGSVPSSPEAGVGHEGSKIWETHATRIVMPKPHSTVDNPRVSPSHSWDTHTAHVLIPAPHSMTAGSESSPQPDSATSRETTTSEDVPFAQTPTLAPSSTTGKSVSSLLPGAATGHRLSGDGEGNRGVCTRTKRNGDGLDTNSEGRVDPDKETSGTDQKETQPSLFSVDKDNLCAVSTYFRSMLNGRFCEGDQNEVQITSCGARAFQGLLAYLLPRPYGVSQAKSKLGGARPVGKLRKGGELIKKEGAVFSVIGDGEELIDTAGALSESVGEGIKGATSGTDKREPQVKTEVDGPSRRESGEWKIWARLKPRRDASKVPMSEDCAVKNPMEAASSGQLKRKWTDSDGRKTDSDDDVVNVDSDASDLHRGKKAKTEPNPSTGIDPQLHDQQTVEEIRVAQSAFAVDSDHNEDLIEDTRWRDDADTTEVRDQSECGDSSELLDGDVDTDDEYDMEGISRDVVGNYTNAKTTTGGTAPLIRRRNEMDIHNAGWRDVGGSGASNETQSADSSVHVRGPAATASIHTHGGITVRIEKTIGPITNACCEKYFYDNLVPEDALALIPVAQQYMLTELRALCIHKTLENLKQFPEDAYQIGLDTNIEILQFAGIGTVIEMLPQLCEDRRWVPNHRILNGIKSYLADQALHIS